jgi:putative DNA primase/helicase
MSYCEVIESRDTSWGRYNPRGELVPCDPPARTAQIILHRPHWKMIPSVAGIITTPTLRPDGSIVSAPGFDSTTRLFHVSNGYLRLPLMPERPSRADALAALQLLKGLLGEFPFVAPVDWAVALSAIISPVVRGALTTVPLHAFSAPAAGSGKSFAMDVISNICTGRDCPVVDTGWEQAEIEKRLIGLMLKGSQMISIDNVTVELGGDLLCQAVDRPTLQPRMFSTLEIEEIENRSTLYANGIALRVRGDMSRRTLISALDPQMERPELREFSGNPVKAVLSNRGAYIAACLTIPRAYLAAGSPDRLPPLASFQTWSDLVRSALVWLGCADPIESMDTVRADDPQLSALRQVLAAWLSCFGSDAMTCATVVQALYSNPNSELRTALAAVASLRGGGGIDAVKLGRWLRNSRDRIADGMKFVAAGHGHGNVSKWAVVVVS